jgi:hypothetical protein
LSELEIILSNLWSDQHATSTKADRQERRKSLRKQTGKEASEASKDKGLTLWAVLVHLGGFYLLSGLMQHEAADNDLLAVWYASFLAVDVIALCIIQAQSAAGYAARLALMVSALWSAMLVVEMLIMRPMLQASDASIQSYIDVTLFLAVLWQSLFGGRS